MEKQNTIPTATTNKVTNKLFTLVMGNAQKIGGKWFAYIPTDLLTVGEYQRTEYYSPDRVNRLARNFDIKLMDPVAVAPHPEEGLFYIVNGMHRVEAAKINGYENIECEIIRDLSDNPSERLIQEANLFRKQMEEVERLSPAAMHKANIICGDRASIDLDNIVKKYNVEYKTNTKRGRGNVNVLTGFERALAVSRAYGRGMLDSIFYILHHSQWQFESCGLGSNAIVMLKNVMIYDKEVSKELDFLVDIIKQYSPKLFDAKAKARYDKRGHDVACSLFLEDLVCEKTGIEAKLHEKYNELVKGGDDTKQK